MIKVIFLGPPGAGKGTQARILEEHYGAIQISPGDILRRNRSAGTDLGKLAQSYMDSGALVPDDVIIKMMEIELARHPNVILDGFPRTAAQAEAFDALLARTGQNLNAVILFNADRSTLIERLSGRWTNPRSGRVYHETFSPPKARGIDDEDGGELVQREDDRPEAVVKRLEVYDQQTKPLVEHYRKTGKLVEIDALKSVDEVTREIERVLPKGNAVAK